ncbi:MAG: hypothetical protein COC22_03810, partial [Flavobacteriaceae bacterium]
HYDIDKYIKKTLETLPSIERLYPIDQYVEWCVDSIKRGGDPWHIFSSLQSDDEWDVLSKLAQYFVDHQLYEEGYAIPRRLQQWALAKATGARKPRSRLKDFKSRNKLYLDILTTLKHDYNMPITIRDIERAGDIAGSDFYSCGCAILAKHAGLSHNQVKDIYDEASHLEKYFMKNNPLE